MEEARKLKSLGPYTLCDVIGEGSFSIVRKAILANSDEIFACKIIPKIKFKERNLAMRFQLEIRVMQALHNPNIVQIYDIFRDKKFYYVIMEYVKGGTLFDYICNNRRIEENKVKTFMYQIVKAMQYIHSLGICHRDLKLENILLNENYTDIKISDFGLSKFLGKDGLTKTPVGSPLYASPECLSGQPYNARKSDIWSCGVIMYALSSGKMPWFGKTQSHIYSQIKKANYEMPSYLSNECKKIIRSILTIDVSKRPTEEEILNSKWFSDITERSEEQLPISKQSKLLSLKNLDKFFQKDIKSRINSASFENLLSLIHDNENSLMPNKKDEKETKKSRKSTLKLKKVPSTTALDIDFEKKLRSIMFENVDFPTSFKHRSSLSPNIKSQNRQHHRKSQKIGIQNKDQNDFSESLSIPNNSLKCRSRCNSHYFVPTIALNQATTTSDNFIDETTSPRDLTSRSDVKSEINSDSSEIQNVSHLNSENKLDSDKIQKESEMDIDASDIKSRSINVLDDNSFVIDQKTQNKNPNEMVSVKNSKKSKYKNKKEKKEKKDQKGKKGKKEKKDKKEKRGKHDKKIIDNVKQLETQEAFK